MNEDVELPSSHRLASSLGVAAQDLQLKKASFFDEDDVVDMGQYTEQCL